MAWDLSLTYISGIQSLYTSEPKYHFFFICLSEPPAIIEDVKLKIH